MNIRSTIAIVVMLVSLAAAGCDDAEPSTSEAIERVTAAQPILTSTAPPIATEPAKGNQESDQAGEPKKLAPDIAELPVAEEAQPFEPTLQSNGGIAIQRLITAPAVEDREPVAPSSVFGHREETVYAFVDVRNESEEAKTLQVYFIGPEERVGGGVELLIPASVPRWRTWAYTKHAKTPGLWRVEIRDAGGTLLGALPFEVEPNR